MKNYKIVGKPDSRGYNTVEVNGKQVYRCLSNAESFRVQCNIDAHLRKIELPFPEQSFPKEKLLFI